MKIKKIKNQPLTKLSSFFPSDENFEDARESVRGAWISDEAWRNIHARLRESDDEEIVETINNIKKGNSDAEGMFITDYQFAILESKITPWSGTTKTSNETSEKKKGTIEVVKPGVPKSCETSTVQKEEKQKPKLTWEQRNMTPYLKLLSKKGEKKKN